MYSCLRTNVQLSGTLNFYTICTCTVLQVHTNVLIILGVFVSKKGKHMPFKKFLLKSGQVTIPGH
jgi:hypothetical protein